MNIKKYAMKRLFSILFLALVVARTWQVTAAGAWTPLSYQAPGGVGLMLLLSDGTVMCQSGVTWYRLTPDINGSYINGTWTTLAPMADSRTYYSSQVLRDGRVFVAGGEYGTGGTKAEIYQPTNNTWTAAATPPNTVIDNISATLPNGNVLEGFPSQHCSIYDIVSNVWSANIPIFDGQDEAEWVKLADGSILTIDPFGTNTERYVPALNQWVRDNPVTTPMYGYGGELGAGFLLPNGKAFFIGGTTNTAIYTPWTTNAAGIYTAAGATNAGTWVAGPSIPNFNAGVDAPAAMMVNGKILCCMTDTNNSFGNGAYYYEYDYLANAFTQVNAPGGGLHSSTIAYGQQMLTVPNGTVLASGFGSQVYSYQPSGSQITNGVPTILNVTTNLDGSFHVTGTLLNGISDGAAYGDDKQMASSYPIARMTNAAGNVLYCRTYNWSTCNVMTGTNVVSTEMTLPAGLLAGTYPLFVTANGFSSAPYSLTISGTPLPAVANLGFTTISSNQMAFKWNDIGLTETGFVIQRSTDGTNYSTLAVVGANTTNYTDNAVTPLGEYYYRVLGTNSVGLGLAAPVIFAASKSATPLPAPWQSGDVGAVLGSGASGTNAGAFTVIGSGAGIRLDNDQFQFVYQPVIGDVTVTARVVASQNTGSNAMAGVMIRSSLGFDVADALMVFDAGAQSSIYEHRADAAALALYGQKIYGESLENEAPDEEPGPPGGPSGSPTVVSRPASAPLWVRLVRTGNAITSYTSTDGVAWTPQGTNTLALPAVAYVGLAVTSGTYNQLNTSTFDNVTVTGTPAAIPPPMAEWKLDETSGSVAEDSIDSFDGLYNNVVLGQPGATAALAYSAGFNGSNANISIPPLNLNSNVLTITAWVNRNGNQNSFSGIFFDRESSTANGLHFGTANELRYTWNNSSITYNASSGLVPPSGVWTFVSLVIEPARARIYMATNGGALSGWTNNVANAVQGFAGNSYIGQDTSSSSRYFNGLLNDVRFYAQALTPAQLSALAASPVIAMTAPLNGQQFLPGSTVNLSAGLSAMSGHTTNLVQFFDGTGSLLGALTNGPYTATVTNLAVGSYSYFARLFYDSGLSVDSVPVNISVLTAPSAPQNVTATAVATNMIFVSWSPAPGANGYLVSRNGSFLAATASAYLLDAGLTPGTNACYTIVATNTPGSSPASASACATTPSAAATLTWNAPASPSGPQDGNSTWDNGVTANWWNGAANTVWSDGSVASIGSGTTTNCLITLANNVSPSAFIFNSGPGAYNITNGGGGIVLPNAVSVVALGNATISANLSGPGALTVSGPGTLTLAGANTNTGMVAVNSGTLALGSIAALPYGAVHSTLNIGGNAVALWNNSGNTGNGTSGNTGWNVNVMGTGIFAVSNSSAVLTLGAANSFSGTWRSDANTAFVFGNASASQGAAALVVNGGSVLLGFNGTSTFGSFSGTGGSVAVNYNFGGAGNGTRTLSINQSANGIYAGVIGVGDNGAGSRQLALIKSGSATLALTGTNTYTGTTTISAGTMQVDGIIGTNTVTVQNTATLAGTGLVRGRTTVQAGGTLAPGDSAIGSLTFSNGLTLAGTALMEVSHSYGSPSGDAVTVVGTLTLGGTLLVTNTDGSAFAAGDSFALFNATAFSGGFSSVNLPSLSAGLAWDTSQLSGGGTISVAALPAVGVLPAATNFNYGGSATLTALASGTGALRYQWFDQNTNAISGATNSTLVLAAPVVAASGNYTVVVTNGFGRATNFCAVTILPASLTVTANSFSKAAGVNWIFAGTEFTSSGLVNGDTVASATLASAGATNAAAAGVYAITVTNALGGGLGNYFITYVPGTLTVTNATVEITSISALGGGFLIVGVGVPGQNFILLGTASLSPASWQPVGTNTADGGGNFSFTNTPPAGSPQQFYRVQLQ